MTVNLAGGNLLLKDHTSGIWKTGDYTPIDNGADYNGRTPEFFVSSSGVNIGGANTEGAAWASIEYAVDTAPPGSIIGVSDDLIETLDFTLLESNPGISNANPTIIVGKTIFTTITGSISAGNEDVDCHFKFEWLYFKGNNSAHWAYAKFCKFISCFFSVPTGASGNNPMMYLGSYQLYEACGFMGDGGRYVTLAYQRENTLVRWATTRSEADVWATDGNPTGVMQTYTSINCARVQCVIADALRQHASAEPLGDFVQTSNVSPGSSGCEDIECIAKNSVYYAFQVEGGNSNDGHLQDCISIGSAYGFGANAKNVGGVITATADGGHIMNALNSALAAYNSGSLTVTGVNIQGSNQDSDGGVSASGITHDVVAPATIVAGLDRIGVAGTYLGEAGWNVRQVGTPLFPLPFEDAIRGIFAAYSNRGFCAVGKTLTSYLSEAV